MSLSTNQQIALRIGGTKERRAGFAHMVSVGVLPPGEGDHMDRTLMVNEKPAYVIKNTPDYILYLLIDRNVKSFDADANGVLAIALTIGAGGQLAAGRSPYELLRQAYDLFVSKYMRPFGDGRDEFLNTDIDNEVFRNLVLQFPVEPRRKPLIPMNPQGLTGTLCVSPDLLPDLFRNTSYKEFATWKDIEVGTACASSPGLDNLTIPQPTNFRVIVNGRQTGKVLSNATDSYTTQEQATNYVEYDNISFTLDELYQAPNNQIERNGAIALLDLENDCISCTVPKKDITYTTVFDIAGVANEEKEVIVSRFASGELKLLFGVSDVTGRLLGEPMTVRAADISQGRFTVKPQSTDDYLFSVASNHDVSTRTLKVRINVKPRLKAAQRPVSDGQPRGSRPPVYDPQRGMGANTAAQDFLEQERLAAQPGAGNKQKSPFTKKTSLLIGFIAGLLVGALLGWGLATLLSGGDEKEKPAPVEEISEPEQQVEAEATDLQAETEEAARLQAEAEEAARLQAEEEEAARQQAEAAAKKAAEEEAKKKADEEDQTKQQALAAARDAIAQACGKLGASLKAIQAMPAWKKLSNDDRIAVEAYLTHRGKLSAKEKKVTNWAELVAARQKIIQILNAEGEKGD